MQPDWSGTVEQARIQCYTLVITPEVEYKEAFNKRNLTGHRLEFLFIAKVYSRIHTIILVIVAGFRL